MPHQEKGTIRLKDLEYQYCEIVYPRNGYINKIKIAISMYMIMQEEREISGNHIPGQGTTGN